MNKALKDVATQLAERMARCHVAYQITEDEAREFIDDRLAADWFLEACKTQTACQVFADALDSMTDSQSSTAFMGLFRDSDLTRYTLANVVRESIAREIAREANLIADEIAEPVDVWDDPVRADLRAMARAS